MSEMEILVRFSAAHLAAVIRAREGVELAPGDALLLAEVFDEVIRRQGLH